MCAICGVGIFKGAAFKDAVLLKELFTKLLIACQGGGRSAAGVSFMREKSVDVLRRGMAASDFILTPEYKELLENCVDLTSVNNRLYSILGHCRIPTKGSPRNNDNNHPIVVGDIIGVHNGCIGNDDSLFERFNLDRIAQVDTEIIFSLLSHFTAERANSIQDSIQRVCRLISGSYACATHSAANPYNLYLFRAHNGTVVRYYTNAGLILFATSDYYIEDAVKNYDLGKYEGITYSPQMGLNFNLYLENMTSFELQGGVDGL